MESTQSLQTGDSAAEQQEAGNQKAKRPAVRHSRDSKRLLKEWFTSHSTWPYPTEQEKQSLSEETGLSVRQVSYWFVNTRRRNSKKLTRIVPNLDADLTAESLANHLQPGEDAWGGMTPLDRWRHSPPEQEPAPIHAICRAVSDGIATSSGNIPGPVPPVSPILDITRSRVGSVSSFDFSTSAPSSEASGNSNSSGSISSFGSQHSRRSRRKPWRSAMRKRGLGNDPSKKGDNRPFQCTFCTDTFKSRYDWTRHEGSLHLVLERWACLPFGPKVLDPAGGPPKCALCDMLNPSDDHIQSHYVHECLAKPLNTRVFFRKDHLRQHLRLVHGIDKMLPEMDKWKSQILKINSRCGFCGVTFTLWSDRNDHLAEHFRSGTLMKDWKGDRGLDAAVSLLVENAMPPYLIGTESNDPDPFSASKGGSKTMKSMVNGQPAPTSFAALTAKLGDYVRAAKASGVAITDDLLRNEARMILYGDADPWNHTPADNAEWMRMFKIGYCLGPDVCPELTSTCSTNAVQPDQNAIGPPAPQSNVDPFTTVKIQHAMSIQQLQLQFNVTDSSTFAEDVYLAPNTDVAVPWPWQMPECLAEFRQMVEQSGLPDPAQTLSFDTTDFGQDVQPLNITHDGPEGFGTGTEAFPWEYTYGLDDMPFPFDFDFTLD